MWKIRSQPDIDYEKKNAVIRRYNDTAKFDIFWGQKLYFWYAMIYSRNWIGSSRMRNVIQS